MFIENIILKNYRNIRELDLNLGKNINIFYGFNGQGKTNLLESIYICAVGRSYRTHTDTDLIMFGEKKTLVNAMVNDEDYSSRIAISFSIDSNKGIWVNGLPIRKMGDLLGTLLVVSFTPEDLSLIKSGPSERRRFIDLELSQLSNVYYFNLKEYSKILKQRNSLLKKINYDKSLKDTLFVWDEKLVEHGLKIMDYRNEFIEKINFIARDIHSKLTKGEENLEILYKPNVNKKDYESKLEKNINKDIIYGNTSVGTHKDDLIFLINGMDVKNYGSQGQQRTAALSTKLAEIKLIQDEKNKNPILLLDDVLSELDKKRQKYLLNSIQGLQTIITCTGVEDIMTNLSDDISVFKVSDGSILQKNL